MLITHLGKTPRVDPTAYVAPNLASGDTVPIGWIAVGHPAKLLPPDDHDKIREIQKPLSFPLTVYGIDRAEADMVKITRKLSAALGSHSSDTVEKP